MESSSASEADRRAPRRAVGRTARRPVYAAMFAAVMLAMPVAMPAMLPAWTGSARAEPVRDADPPAAAAADAPATPDLSALLSGMRSTTGVVAHFTETKELALLSAPLEAAGTIYFVPPDRLVRLVTSPGRSRLVVDGDRARFEDDTGHKGLDLAGSPMARQLIDSFVVLFNGDEARLKELYETDFSAQGGTWRLRLVPRSSPLDRMIASFDLSGAGPRIDRMEAVEPDGDRTVTRFGQTDVQYRFGEKELAELFGAPPS